LFLISADGGQPRQLHADFASATEPVWAPDGAHLLFMGRHPASGDEIWMTPVDGGEPVRTELRALCSRYGISFMHLDSWAAGSDYVVFSGVEGDAENLWRARISTSTWTFSDRPERLTFGVAEKEATVAAGGRIAFVNGARRVDIWSLPAHLEEGVGAGELERLTQSGATDTSSDSSERGHVITFRSNRSGTSDVWTKDIVTGRAFAVTSNAELESMPKISPDGSRVAFSLSGSEPRTIRVAVAAGGLAERVCQECGPPSGWSPDSSKIYYLAGFDSRTAIHILDLASGEHHPLVTHPEYPIYAPRMSFDGRWMAFKIDLPAGTTQVFAAPVEDEPPPFERWVKITDGGFWDDIPRWSPGGGMIYLVSDRDGFRCIWARRVDPTTKQPRGDVFPVQHFHQLRLSMLRLSLNEFELAVARDRLVFPLAELSGNIWLMEPAANP
jgi:Tol biopolymer transport system component